MDEPIQKNTLQIMFSLLIHLLISFEMVLKYAALTYSPVKSWHLVKEIIPFFLYLSF